MNAPTRPVLRWHGGKWRLAPWIIQYFPAHTIYVEPFGGAASVLLRKTPTAAEIYNDLDGRLVNLFRVLRDVDKAADLKRRVELTLFARAEFDWAYGIPADDVDDAHRMIVLSFMGHGSDSTTRTCRTGFRSRLSDNRALPSQAWSTWHRSIPEFADRLRGVVIEQCPAAVLIERFARPDTLFYVDPPYLPETRSAIANGRAKTHGYRHELTAADHEELLALLDRTEGMVVLSGYPSELYDDMLSGWTRVETRALADGARPRTEVLWLNPACLRALDEDRAQLEIFGGTATQ